MTTKLFVRIRRTKPQFTNTRKTSEDLTGMMARMRDYHPVDTISHVSPPDLGDTGLGPSGSWACREMTLSICTQRTLDSHPSRAPEGIKQCTQSLAYNLAICVLKLGTSVDKEKRWGAHGRKGVGVEWVEFFVIYSSSGWGAFLICTEVLYVQAAIRVTKMC